MKYKWIDLQNYAGIYNGMQLNQIKIDFTKCKTNKILIRGMNGSGKSTLMDAINVNPDSNDKFIPNVEARKNICLEESGKEYIIRYIHPVTGSGARGTTKGYISKFIDGKFVELNPNGNISSCRDILYEEFNLDANFLALSQLSSENRGLVDKKPAERKKLLNNIMDILDTYNNIYKILNKKSSIFKSTINSLTYKIDSIGDETTLQLNLKAIEDRIASLEKQKDSLIESAAAIKVKMNEYLNILKINNYDAVVNELNQTNTDFKSVSAFVKNTIQKYGISDINEVESFLKHLEAQCIKLESDIENDRKQLPLLLAQRESEYKEIENKNAKLNALQSDYNYLDIKRAKQEAQNTVMEYDKIFNEMHLKNINMISKSEYDSAMESLQYLLNIGKALISNYDNELVKACVKFRSNINRDIINLKSEKNILEKTKNDLLEAEKKLYEFESMRKVASTLVNRPSECNIDTCPYIKEAVEANNKYPEAEYIELQDTINSLKSFIQESTEKIEFVEESIEVIKQLDLIDRELKSKMCFISKLPVRSDFAETFLDRLINNDSFNDITDLYKYIDCGNMIEEYKVAKQNLHNFEVEYKIYESKNEMIESILSSLESLNEKATKLANDIESINTKIKNSEMELSELKSAKDKVNILLDRVNNEYLPLIQKQEQLINTKNSLENNNIEINKLQVELNNINTSLGSINNDIKKNTNERDELKHASQLLVEYKAEYEIYSKKYSKIDKIKYYASPNTGIQTLFMELYMNKIIAIANNLLSLLFNGEFALQPFIINENEFRIPCVGSGLMHDDISSMSTAQRSMISMILSFSLLYQSSTKYNIIKLDEIDGCLDTTNRGYFTALLDNLMSLLKCEQCFIVSHNDELSSYACDLILLKMDNGHAVREGENIIWKY